MDDLNQIVQIVRIGTVSAVDKEKRMARVIYKDLGITSGWLYVLDTTPISLIMTLCPRRRKPKPARCRISTS